MPEAKGEKGVGLTFLPWPPCVLRAPHRRSRATPPGTAGVPWPDGWRSRASVVQYRIPIHNNSISSIQPYTYSVFRSTRSFDPVFCVKTAFSEGCRDGNLGHLGRLGKGRAVREASSTRQGRPGGIARLVKGPGRALALRRSPVGPRDGVPVPPDPAASPGRALMHFRATPFLDRPAGR